MTYTRRMTLGALLGLVAAAILGAAITHGNIKGGAFLLYPTGLLVGFVVAHMTALWKIRREYGRPPTPRDYYVATRKSGSE